jgi:ribosome biogenesis GTPase
LPELSSHPLLPVGWSERVQALFAPLADQGLVPARVVGVERGWCRLATPAGEGSLPIGGKDLRRNSLGGRRPNHGLREEEVLGGCPSCFAAGPLAIGDWVALDGEAVHKVLPRWSTLRRLDPDGVRQVLAANIDVVLIAAPGDRLSPTRVERELVIAWDSGARPVVVLTKLDLAPSGAAAELAARLGAVDVIGSSALAEDGLGEVRDLLVHPITAAFLGPSGAGKSTLINALLGEDLLAVGSVRSEDRRGRHTTTSRQLVPLPSGGSVIDMPGLRSLATDASDGAVASAFPEIDELAHGCRFADCAHQVEPGCAVLAAAASGDLASSRLASYHKLARETAFERRRTDRLAHTELVRTWKARSKEQRRISRERER